MATKRIRVPKTAIPERIDLFLAQAMKVSRAVVQKLMKANAVTIDGVPVTRPHTSILPGTTIIVEIAKELASTEPIPILDVLFEDKDVIVFNKPAGALVHPAKGQNVPTMVDALLAHDPKIKRVGDSPERPGIVHRLDRLASGVMIAAKTQAAFTHLKLQFSSRLAKKEYLVLVYGRLARDTGTIRLRLARSARTGHMVATPEENEEEGKEAVTHFEVIERFKTATLVRVKIETGRTHQIRAHFRAFNHPVVGDTLYKKTYMKNIRVIPLDRLFLHAAALTITLPSGEERRFDAPTPQALADLLLTLPKP